MKKKLLVVCGGQSSEHSISRISCNSVMKHLDKDKYEIYYLSYQGGAKSWYRVDKFLQRVPHDEVGKIYQSCDILLKTSILESFSYPPLEMMATGGLAVVAPNGGNIEYLRDEENCLMYKLGDIDKAVEQIDRLAEDALLRERLIAGGLETAKKREWSKIEEQIVTMYRDLKENADEY